MVGSQAFLVEVVSSGVQNLGSQKHTYTGTDKGMNACASSGRERGPGCSVAHGIGVPGYIRHKCHGRGVKDGTLNQGEASWCITLRK